MTPPSSRQTVSASSSTWTSASAPTVATPTVAAGPEAARYAPSASYESPYDVPPAVTRTPINQDAPFTPRVARLTVASIDPFSVLKLSFLLSVAAGVALVVAVTVLWFVLKGIGVFDQVNTLFQSIGGLDTTTQKFNIYDYIGLKRIVSISVLIGVVDMILLTALSTVAAFLYNLASGLVGGVRVTLSDD